MRIFRLRDIDLLRMLSVNGEKNKQNVRMLFFSIIAMFLVFVCIFVAVFTTNNKIDFEIITIDLAKEKPESEKVTVKIAHLSDMHFGDIEIDLDALLLRLRQENPHFIAITGDITESNVNIYSCGVLSFIEKASLIAPIYYVNGNHELILPSYKRLCLEMEKRGVTVLSNNTATLTIEGKKVVLLGLTDSSNYKVEYVEGNPNAYNGNVIVLAHRPEKFESNYSDASHTIRPSLVLSGHAHGGQFRIPYPVYAPHQGFFPKYTSGLYVSNDQKTNMVVSRGVGNSSIKLRLSNPPHVPILQIKI